MDLNLELDLDPGGSGMDLGWIWMDPAGPVRDPALARLDPALARFGIRLWPDSEPTQIEFPILRRSRVGSPVRAP